MVLVFVIKSSIHRSLGRVRQMLCHTYEIREIQEDGKVRKQRTGSKAGSNDIKSPV